MDLIANDLKYAVNINSIVGNKCCSDKLKELELPGHSDWMYVAFGCSCGEWWKIWRNESEMQFVQAD